MILFRALVFSLLFIGSAAYAGQFYRWVDENGVTYIQSYIPPEFVANGYEIIDDNGIVLKKVAPQMSEAERDAQEAEKISAEMQRARDEELLKLYRSPSDVDKAQKTWLSRMDMEIRVKQNRIRIKESELSALQSKAANLEKTGQEITQDLLDQMQSVELEIKQFNLEIEEVTLRQNESKAAFQVDRDRMVELWEMLNNKPWVEPEAAQ